MTEKDSSIVDLLDALNLESRAWEVVDHWEGDLCATGVAARQDRRRLVYVSTFDHEPGRYSYQCEIPNGPDEVDYRAVRSGENVTLRELIDAMELHLG